MRACFLGQHIYELGNGIAVLKSVWQEAEPPKASEEKDPTVSCAKSGKKSKKKTENNVR